MFNCNCWVSDAHLLEPKMKSMVQRDFIAVWQFADGMDDDRPYQNARRLAGNGDLGFPFFMVLDTDGKEIARLVPPDNLGNLTNADFVDFLRKAKHEFASR